MAQLDAVIELLTAIKEQPGAPSGPLQDRGGQVMGNHCPPASHTPQPVPLPSKKELAVQWLAEHPEDRKRSGRDLANSVRPQGVEIGYRTWHAAKKAH